ncbi:MAG: ATP-binding protein, partial [Planctomycetota bacterium]|nr:ATP-binding protein [Planctomycetota bacterium]
RNLLALCGKRPLMRAPASLQRIVENTLTIVKHEFETEGVEIRCDFQPTPTFAMDAAQIGQVAMNLIINARQAMLASPQRRLTVECGTLGQEVFLCVTDTGCGIAAEEMPRIFTPFYTTKGERAEGEHAQPGLKGIGLGLTVSRRIVEEHGGRIEVESQLGRGSSFTVWLPVRDPLPESPAAAPRSTAALSGRVLILEDEPKLRALFAEVLQRIGLTVETTDHGDWAKRRLAAERFDLVLLDLQMPQMSGYRFLEICREAAWPQKPKFLIMTGKLVFEPPPLQGLEFVGFLAKPFHIDRLCEGAEAALRK